MTDLLKGQPVWTKLGNEFALPLGVIKWLRDVERRLDGSRNRTQVVDEQTPVSVMSTWAFSGVATGGQNPNTDPGAILYPRALKDTPGAGNVTVNVYSAPGASGLVAQGVIMAPPGVCALTAQNGSGLSGSVAVSANPSASETNDAHILRVFQDWYLRSNTLFDLSEPEHGALKNRFEAALDAARGDVLNAIAQLAAFLNTFETTRLANFTGSSSSSSPISLTTKNSNGAVTTNYVGVLEDTRKDMVDETSPAAQAVVKNTVSAGAVAFDNENQGLGAIATPTLEQWSEDGPVTGVCTDDTFGFEKFQITQRTRLGGLSIQAQQPLQIKQSFADPNIGIKSMTLVRTITFGGGALSTDFGSASSWSINGENAGNTAAGDIFMKVIAAGGGFLKSTIAIGAGAASKTFKYSYSGGAVQTITTGGGVTTCDLLVAALTADTTFNANFAASNDGSNFLLITLRSTADGSYGLITNGTINGQGGSSQDTFTNNSTVGQFRVDGYTSANLNRPTQVFTTTNAYASGAVVVSQQNGQGITGAGVIGSQPISGDTGTLELNGFQRSNGNNVPDKFTFQITAPNSARGEFQDRLAELQGYALNGVTKGSETLDDRAVLAGTFVPYSVRDA